MDVSPLLPLKVFLFVYLLSYTQGHYRNPLNKYIRHYEGLSYDTELVHSKHQRVKRALSHEDRFLHLDFHAHGRHFNLRMKRDTTLFSPDLKVEVSGEEIPYDTSHIYTGEIYGEKGTLTHGSVVDGKFEGFIQSYHGTYYVEPAERYLEDKDVPFHSVIYHEDDIHYPHKYGPEGGCADSSVFERMRKYQASAVEEPAKELHTEAEAEGPVLLRRKRMAQAEKNTCQLFIQTDHLFYRYYKSNEAVIAQLFESGQPICGNGLVEPGEECDCGYSDQCRDQCCYDANQPDKDKCKLKPNKVCSPSQGPCCTRECTYKGRNEKCREESECAHQGMCSGTGAQCPTSEPKANFTACHGETQVCLNGGCSGSICEKYGLEACTCASQEGKDETELCHVCCMEKMNPNTCSSTGSERLARFFNKKVTTLPAGSPCNDFRGYCDVFMKCRLVDADGPLARLKKAIFNPELYENIAEWIVAHWWAVLLMGIALIMLMAGFIKICSVHTPSSNPKLPPPKPLPGTLKRRRAQQHASSQVQHQSQHPHAHGAQRQARGQPQRQPQPQRHHRQPRENYQMGQMRR
ncbi:PREDICTED: disintegrin and metalloproteinase domain-containing protein 10-like [Cyprinodon variegatus]|uniref:disintegrin and metalloproteinase domain-containing protein 10-like n=1 Tax=Cyprinodon variegatus TaxID=28743 RepID=UPI0007429A0F|nr:PREDICTED: disintegrin and metalloproteinase domain-containing protein 10-like [Cyprinodon variegatus]